MYSNMKFDEDSTEERSTGSSVMFSLSIVETMFQK
jgi:hypothetical protein